MDHPSKDQVNVPATDSIELSVSATKIIEEQERDYMLDLYSRLPYPDDDTSVFAFAKEGPSPADQFTYDRFDVDGLKDVQISRNPEKLSPEERAEQDRIKERAQKACAKCPGHCCLAFVMWQTKADWRKLKKETLKRLREVRVKLRALGPKPEWLAARQEDEANLKKIEFYLANFYRALPRLEKNGSDYHSYTYSCRKFDPVARRCTAYAERPPACQSFICGAATVGIAPTGRSMATKQVPKAMRLIRAQDIYDPNMDFGMDREPVLPVVLKLKQTPL